MLRIHLAVALLFIALATAMTWPLAFAIDRAVLYAGDPYINTWILDWDYHATMHRPLKLFHANTFVPARYTLAFSENLYGIAFLLFPLRFFGVDALTAHNLAVLFGFAFSGFAAYLVGRRVSGSVLAGIAGGIFYAFVPFRFTQLSHVQHVWGGWVPMLIFALLCYADAPTWRNAWLFGAVFLMNGLSNVHWLLFGSLAIALSVPIALKRWRDLGPIVVTTAAALLLLAPFLYPYEAASKLYGMQRNADEALGMSATMRDWLNPGFTNRFYRRFGDPTTNPECWLFPGALSIVLSIAGAFAVRGKKRPAAIALLWVVVGVLGSFGLHGFFHQFLFTHVPGFRAIRVPARWANIAYAGMSMLIALAVAPLVRRWRLTGAVVAALFLVELHAAPIRWFSASPTVPGVYQWLAHHRARIAELPIDTDESEYRYVRWSTVHHLQMVNGASGFVPPEFQLLDGMWHTDPIPDSFARELQRLGVTHVVVHGDWFGPRECEWLRRELARGRLSYVQRFSENGRGDWLFAMREGRSTAPELEHFLSGGYTYNPGTFGMLDSPDVTRTLTPEVRFSGWALSPWGVKKVDLLFGNGVVRVPTTLVEDKAISRGLPYYPKTPRPRFVALFDHRPSSIRRETDVQVEITDGRGVKSWLEDRFIEWP